MVRVLGGRNEIGVPKLRPSRDEGRAWQQWSSRARQVPGRGSGEVAAERQRTIAEWALESSPEKRDKLVGEGRMEETRSSLRHVRALRGFTLSAEDEGRIDACDDLDTLRRWHDHAAVVASAAEALQ